MSFFYPTKWGGMGSNCMGCGLGAWTPGDFSAEEIQKSKDVGNALESLSITLGNRGLAHSKAEEKAKALAAQKLVDSIFSQTGLRAGGEGPLSLDGDEKIYKVNEMIDALYQSDDMSGELLSFVDNSIHVATAGRIVALSSLVTESGNLYDLYFDKYYEEDKGAPAGAPKPPVTDPVTGKVKVPKAKQTVKKAGLGVMGWVAVGIVAAGAGYLALSAKKTR